MQNRVHSAANELDFLLSQQKEFPLNMDINFDNSMDSDFSMGPGIASQIQ